MSIDTSAEANPPTQASAATAITAAAEANDPITQAYLDAVQRLEGFADMDPELLDGFLSAMACAPQPLPFSDALAELAGDDYERCFADPVDRTAADAAFGGYLARIVGQLDPEGLESGAPDAGLRPYMHGFDEAARAEARNSGVSDEDMCVLHDGATWAMGFADGLEFAFERSAPLMAPKIVEAMRNCLAHVNALGLGDSGQAFEAHIKRWWKGRKPSRDDLVDTALGSVEEFRLLWLEASLTPEPLVSDKVGRNEPCPCGSGKKFKKCHGAA